MTTGRSCINSVNLYNFFFFSEETENLVGEGKKKTSTRKQKVTTGRLCVNSINIINFLFFSEETECLVVHVPKEKKDYSKEGECV